MTKVSFIHWTLETLQQLPEDKVIEVAEFAEFLLKKQEELLLQRGIEMLVSESESFAFLEEEEDLYTLEDLYRRPSVATVVARRIKSADTDCTA